MTKEERVERERQKQWVEARFKCTPGALFSTLSETLRADVDTFNGLAGENKYAYYNPGDDPDIFEVSTSHGGRDNATVRLQRCGSEITIKGPECFKVKAVWDDDRLQCVFILDDGDLEVERTHYQISQRALGELMFRPGEYPPRR